MENSKCVNCGEIREENFDICWNCGYQFEVIVNNPTNDYKEENKITQIDGTTKKLNSAGKSLKAIAKTTIYLFITNFIFICGILLSGVLDTKFYVMIGIVEIIMVINIIYELFNAGNELMSISSNDSKVKE
jgi:hypothetical protein